MDHYVEQLVRVKKGAREWGLTALILLAAAAVAVACFWFMYILSMLSLLLTAGAVYGAYWLISGLSVEMEYCVTNGDIDIDRIVAKRKRKRVVSVRGGKILSLEPFNGTIPAGFDRTVMAASSPDAAGCWRFTYHSKKNGSTQVIFEPTEALLDELIGGLPRPLQIQVRQQRG